MDRGGNEEGLQFDMDAVKGDIQLRAVTPSFATRCHHVYLFSGLVHPQIARKICPPLKNVPLHPHGFVILFVFRCFLLTLSQHRLVLQSKYRVSPQLLKKNFGTLEFDWQDEKVGGNYA